MRRILRRPVKVVFLCAIAVLMGFLPALSTAEASYPKPVGNVNDFVGVLSSEDIANLDALIQSVFNQTGVTYAVAIVDTRGSESLEVYAAKLFEEWGIGKKGDDRGLLVLLCMKEREVRVEVGYGLEPVITDARAGECRDKMIPYFKEGQYGKGIYAGLLHATKYIEKEMNLKVDVTPATRSYEQFTRMFYIPVGLVLAFPVLVMILAVSIGLMVRKKHLTCPRCRSRLAVTEKVISPASAIASGLGAKVYTCPVCGYYREDQFRIPPIVRYRGGGPMGPMGPGPFFGGPRGGGGFSGPTGFGGGRSGGGGASGKW